MAISDALLDTSIWTEIRTKLVAAAPYITNSTTSATTAATINAQYNDKDSSKPQICILPVELDESAFKFGGYQGKKLINVSIECWGNNTLNVDQLAAQVQDALKTNPITGIDIIGITSNYAFNTAADSKYHLKVVTFTYDRE